MSDESPKKNLPPDQATMAGDIPTAAPPPPTSTAMQYPVIQIDGYRILNEISRGGQAVVYCAIFLKTGRRVAVKVMREGPLATEGGRARFTREAQILASLNHPGIVTILDRGQTADGSEYFAMDYIEGQSLDDATWKLPKYMESVNPDPSLPLKLFLKICDAVNAAHLRGIVHRDLKPSNIRLDERGEPHVLDFGLARGSMSEELPSSAEPVTITGQFLGSLPWASPEQAEGIGQKIDMRSDVYSLGVILYQLVTGGTFPYQVVGSMRDVLNNIITATPPAPSQILTERESRDAARRIKRIGSNHKLINPALDSIILKALAKRRDDRYQSAGELARDIESYLAGRPLQASATVQSSIQQKKLLVAIAIAVIFFGSSIALYLHLNRAETPLAASQTPAPIPAPTAAQNPIAPNPAARSSLYPEYQELEAIMNRFQAITQYIHDKAPTRIDAWKQAADKNDPVGIMLMSRCTEYGEVVPQQIEEGQRMMRRAADMNLPMAQCLLGIRNRASKPPIQNYALAMQWYKLAVANGNARAMIDLALMHRDGLGTAVDYKTAIDLFKQAAAQNAPAAYTFLGDIYRNPKSGVTNNALSIEMYNRAIALGDVEAIKRLSPTTSPATTQAVR